jgi:hypothetical protein
VDPDLLRAREVVASTARQEIDKLRQVARGEPISGPDLVAIADHIEWAIAVLSRLEGQTEE